MLFQKNQSERDILSACVKGKPAAQKKLYEHYFNYAMSVAMRYAGSRDEAIEVVNDAYMKVFSSISKFDPSQSFKAWFRQIVVFTAIDQYRKTVKNRHESIETLYVNENADPNVFSDLGEEEILKCVQELPVSYRTVFVLYAVEGYKHHEIAKMLHISEGTSKSNLSVAREKLRSVLSKSHKMKRHG